MRLWHDRQDRLVAYALLREDPAFDCEVAPEYAGAGLEAEALDWAETRLSELRQHGASQWGGPLVTGVRQDNAERIAFLERHGFRYRGEFTEVNMLRSLAEPIPPAAAPAGCQVRSLADDADEIAERTAAYREVWLPWTDGDLSAEDYARFMPKPADRHPAFRAGRSQRRGLRPLHAAAWLRARSRHRDRHARWGRRRAGDRLG